MDRKHSKQVAIGFVICAVIFIGGFQLLWRTPLLIEFVLRRNLPHYWHINAPRHDGAEADEDCDEEEAIFVFCDYKFVYKPVEV